MSQKIWFTADTHQGHANIIRYDNVALGSKLGYLPRPYKNTDEMDADMIEKWNSVVSEGDIVYHLGDLSLDKNIHRARDWVKQLNGKIYIVLGNHKSVDKVLVKDGLIEQITPEYELKVPDDDAPDGKQLIVLAHYAHRVWNHSHHGAWHLYGHSHGSLADLPDSLSLDAGIMLYGMKPISYETVKEIMAKKTFVPIDRHRE